MLASSRTARACAVALLAILAAAEGCASPAPSREYETVVPSLDEAPPLAMFEWKGRVLLARVGKLSTFDPATSQLQDLGGPEYQTCKGSLSTDLWPDFRYPTPLGARLTGAGSLELANGTCGIWRVDPALPSAPEMIVRWDLVPPSKIGATTGPGLSVHGMYAADVDDETFVCLSVQGGPPDGVTDLPYHDHVEIWSIAAGGEAERIASAPPLFGGPGYEVYPDACTGIVADRDGIYFAAAGGYDGRLYRVDRATKTVTSVLEWNGDSLDASLRLTKDSLVVMPASAEAMKPRPDGLAPPNLTLPIVRIDRRTLASTLVVAGTAYNAPLRYDLQVVGDQLYYLDGFSLRRVPLAGGDVDTVVEGSAHEGAFLGYAVVGPWVYFDHVSHADGKEHYALWRTPR